MKSFVKTFATIILGLALTVGGAKAASTSLVLLPGQFTNFVNQTGTGGLYGSVKVSQVIISASSTNVANISFVDSPTNLLTNVVASSTYYTQYATNFVTTYTNYYGATNNFTNQILTNLTVNFPGATNTYNMPFRATVTTNQVVRFDQATYTFLNGLWVTNAVAPGSGPATLTIVYTQ
jgi:hypothetical protein